MADGEIYTDSEHIYAERNPTPVSGSKPIPRDLYGNCRAILDPHGDDEYDTELRYGSPVVLKVCYGRQHRGRRDIPATEFRDGDSICKWCRLRDETPIVRVIRQHFLKAFRADARRKVSP